MTVVDSVVVVVVCVVVVAVWGVVNTIPVVVKFGIGVVVAIG